MLAQSAGVVANSATRTNAHWQCHWRAMEAPSRSHSRQPTGIYSADLRRCAVYPLDFRFRRNGGRWVRDDIPNYITTSRLVFLVPMAKRLSIIGPLTGRGALVALAMFLAGANQLL